jgi:hypothetical protein
VAVGRDKAMDIDPAELLGGPLDGLRVSIPIPNAEKYPTRDFPCNEEVSRLVSYGRTSDGTEDGRTIWRFSGYPDRPMYHVEWR